MIDATDVELRVHDTREDMPGVLVPLAALLRQLEARLPGALSGRWRVEQGVYGYGEHVMELEEVASAGPVVIEGASLFPVLLTDRECLHHGALAKLDGDRLELGVFDSTFLFVRCRRELATALAAQFRHTELAELA